MTMTPQQAAEVLRAYKTWREGKPVLPPIYEDLTAAFETAIAVMQATPPTDEQIGQLFENRSDCYADTWHYENDVPVEGDVVMAMTRAAFTSAVKDILTSCNSK